MNKGLLIGIVVVIGVLAVIAATSGLFKQGQVTQETLPNVPEKTSIEQPELIEGQGTTLQEVKEFTLTARRWSFQPSVITVNQGDNVKLTITSVDVTHGFALRDFGISTVLSPGKAVEVEFIADKKGTFTFFCSVPCGAGHSGMNGRLVVE